MKYKLLKDTDDRRKGDALSVDECGFVSIRILGNAFKVDPKNWPLWLLAVCDDCEKPPCLSATIPGHEVGKKGVSFCHGHAVESVLPYPVTLDPWFSCDTEREWADREDANEFDALSDLLATVFRNRRNRDARPLRDGEECRWVNTAGHIFPARYRETTLEPEIYWRTNAEAQTFADLLTALLGGK